MTTKASTAERHRRYFRWSVWLWGVAVVILSASPFAYPGRGFAALLVGGLLVALTASVVLVSWAVNVAFDPDDVP